jgi:hypothetical protein
MSKNKETEDFAEIFKALYNPNRLKIFRQLTACCARGIVRYHLTWVKKNPEWARFLFQKRHAEYMDDTEDDMKRLNAAFIRAVSGWFNKHIQAGKIRLIASETFIITAPYAKCGNKNNRCIITGQGLNALFQIQVNKIPRFMNNYFLIAVKFGRWSMEKNS